MVSEKRASGDTCITRRPKSQEYVSKARIGNYKKGSTLNQFLGISFSLSLSLIIPVCPGLYNGLSVCISVISASSRRVFTFTLSV